MSNVGNIGIVQIMSACLYVYLCVSRLQVVVSLLNNPGFLSVL